jgi:enediyne biosynthesis protein E4
MQRRNVCASAIAALAAGGAHAQNLFTDSTAEARIDCVYQGGFMLGAGAAGDFDNDGDQDLFVAGGNATDQLLINDGTGAFTDQAAAWGVARAHPTGGVAVGDFNNDGWLDIFVASQSAQGHSLYRNNGDRTFTDVALAAGVNYTSSTAEPDGFGAAFGDYDLDGDLDLAVAGWNRFTQANRLYQNNGDGTFTVVSDQSNPQAPLSFPARIYGFSPRFHDMDDDLYPELLWVADFATSAYYRNNRDATFTNITTQANVGQENNGMGQTVADLNNDGLPDWYVTSIQTGNSGNMLYMNQGNHQYLETSLAAGVRNGAWGWGTVAVDIDHDADLDLIETNGWNEWNSPSLAFINNGDATSFIESAAALGIDHTEQGRGLIRLDLENDGDQDLIFFASGGSPARVFRNNLDHHSTSWSRVTLDTNNHPRLAPNGIGTRVVLTAGGLDQHRWIDSGSSYISQSELTAHFAWPGDAPIEQIRVHWTNGTITTITNPPANTNLNIRACAADDNLDGSVTSADVLSFINRFLKRERAADLADPLGRTDFFDIAAFLNAYTAGCH